MTVDGSHKCPWPDCDKRIVRSQWGCREHWYALPWDIRGRITRGWRGSVAAHMAALEEADVWIKNRLEHNA